MRDATKRRKVISLRQKRDAKPAHPMPAGWYVTPDPRWERWHNGQTWTSKVQRVYVRQAA